MTRRWVPFLLACTAACAPAPAAAAARERPSASERAPMSRLTPLGAQALLQRFNAAIADAAVYRHADLRRLRPLAFDPGTGTASVTTLTGSRYAIGTQTLSGDVWVTGAGEVRSKCGCLCPERRQPRHGCRRRTAMFLRQLLGLHPNSSVKHFVTMSVRRADVFRPATNPDTTARWPCRNPRARSCGRTFPAGVPVSHVIWMADEMAAAWQVATPLSDDGYPWTRLGYTYNWRRGADRYGASEYVVRAGATVRVTAVTPYRRYCR